MRPVAEDGLPPSGRRGLHPTLAMVAEDGPPPPARRGLHPTLAAAALAAAALFLLAFPAPAEAQNPARLRGMYTSSGFFTPEFAQSTTAYTVTVPGSVASITVTPTVATAGGTVTVNGATVASGSASAAIALTAGTPATITVVVSAAGRADTTYTLTANRESSGIGHLFLERQGTEGVLREDRDVAQLVARLDPPPSASPPLAVRLLSNGVFWKNLLFGTGINAAVQVVSFRNPRTHPRRVTGDRQFVFTLDPPTGYRVVGTNRVQVDVQEQDTARLLVSCPTGEHSAGDSVTLNAYLASLGAIALGPSGSDNTLSITSGQPGQTFVYDGRDVGSHILSDKERRAFLVVTVPAGRTTNWTVGPFNQVTHTRNIATSGELKAKDFTGLSAASCTVQVGSTPPPGLNLAGAGSVLTVTEGGTLTPVTTLTPGLPMGELIAWARIDQETDAGDRGTLQAPTLSAGATALTVSLATTDDTIVETPETMHLLLADLPSGYNYIGEPPPVVLTINDNDSATVAISAEIPNGAALSSGDTVTEGTEVLFTAQLNLDTNMGQTATGVEVLIPGAATTGLILNIRGSGSNQLGNNRRFAFSDRNRNGVLEGTELLSTVTGTLTSGVNLRVSRTSKHTIDTSARFRLRTTPAPALAFVGNATTVAEGGEVNLSLTLGSALAADSSVGIAVSGDANLNDYTAPSSLTLGAGETSFPFKVTITDDSLIEGLETLTLTLRRPSGVTAYTIDSSGNSHTISINDDDVPGIAVDTNPTMGGAQTALDINEGGRAEYTVVLDNQPTAPVTITPISSNADALRIESAPLRFTTGNWDTAQTVLVSAPDNDSITPGLFMAVIGTITHQAVSTDSNYNKTFSEPDVDFTVNDDDEAGIVVDTDPLIGGAQDELNVTEGATASYTVALATRPTHSVTLTPTSSDAAATVSGALTFTTDNWNSAQTVTVTGADDDDIRNETAAIRHGGVSPDDNYNTNFALPAVRVTVLDDDSAGVVVDTDPDMDGAQSALAVTEGATATYTVVLTSLPTRSVTVTPSSGAATKAAVSTARMDNALLFTTDNWDTPQTVTVSGVADDSDFNNETVTINHAAASDDSSYTITTANLPTVTVTVDDDDTPTTPTLQFVSATASIAEGGTLTLAVDMTPALTVNSNVVVGVTDGSTSVVLDYTSPTPLLSLTANTASFSIELVTRQDRVAEGPETLTVTLAAISSPPYDLGAQSSVAVTIIDDDTAGMAIDTDLVMPGVQSTALAVTEGSMAEYTVVLTSQPVDNIAIGPTVSLAPKLGLSGLNPDNYLFFTTDNWSTAQTVTVTPLSDDDASDETDTISHFVRISGSDSRYGLVASQDIVVSISDDDSVGVLVDTDPVTSGAQTALAVTEGAMATYTMALTSLPAGDVTVAASSGGSAAVSLSGLTLGVLTFTTANWNSAQTVTVTGLEDDDTDDETATISHTAASALDAAYNGVTAPEVAVTVTDADSLLPTVQFSAAGASVAEGATVTLTLALSQALGTASSVEVAVDAASPNTAEAEDFTALSFTTLALPATVTSVTLTLATVQDSVAEGNETLMVNLSLPTGVAAWQLGARSSFTVTITDDDTAGVSVLNLGNDRSAIRNLNVQEGETLEYRLVLTSQPAAPVTVTLTSSDTSAVTAAPSPLTFAATSWNMAQVFTVSAVEDPDSDNETGISVSFMVTSTDTAYNNFAVAPFSVSTVDNDNPQRATLAADMISTAEGGSMVTLTATLDRVVPAGKSETLSLTLTGSAMGGGVDYTLSGTAFTFSAGDDTATLTLTVVDDNIVESAENVIIGITSANLIFHFPAALTLTITDNDTAGVVVDTDPDMDGAQTALSVVEAGDTVGYTMVLTSQPANPVTVSVSLPTGTDIGLAGLTSGGLVFTTANWNSAQTVTVAATDDANMVNETVTLSHSTASADTNYNGLTVPSVTINVIDDDLPAVQFSAASASIAEGGTVTLTLELSAALTTASSVGVAVDVGGTNTAAAGDFTALSSATLALPASETSVTLTLATVDDALVEGPETLMVNLSVPTGASGWNLGAQSSITVTITDDETTPAPTIAFGGAAGATADYTATVAEASGMVQVPVTLSAGPGASTTFAFTVDGTATEGADYAAITTKSVTFAAGVTTQTITINLTNDTDVEPNETLTLTLAAADPAPDDLGDLYTRSNSAELTVTSEDVPPPPSSITLSVGSCTRDCTVAEDAGNVVVTAALDQPAGAGGVAVTLIVLEPQSKVDSNDYTLPAGPFTIAEGETELTVSAAITDDQIDEPRETMDLRASTTTAGISNGFLRLLITDNDTAGFVVDTDPGMTGAQTALSVLEGRMGTYTVVLTSQPVGNVLIDITAPDAATATLSGPLNMDGDLIFTPANWNAAQTVTVTGTPDADTDDESRQIGNTFSASSADPIYARLQTTATVLLTIVDAPTLAFSAGTAMVAEGGSVVLSLALSSGLAAASSVNVAVTRGPAAAPADFTAPAATLALAARTTAFTMTLTTVDDALSEGNEDLTLSLSVPAAVTTYGLASPSSVVVTIVDNDQPTVQFTEASAAAAEGSAVTLSLELSAALTANTSVDVAVDVASPNTADAMDFTPLAAATLALPSGSTTVTLVLSTVDDSLAEGDETLMVELSAPSGVTAWTPGTQDSITVTITDDDMAGVSVLENTADEVPAFTRQTFEGNRDRFRLLLTSQPTAPVTVTLTSSNTNAVTVSMSPLTFAVSSWNMAQTFTVNIEQDADSQDPASAITVSFMVTSTDTIYDGLTVRPFTYTVMDDDVPMSATLAADMAPAEGGGMVTLTATLDRAVPADQAGETLSLTLTGSAMGGGVDYTLSGTAFMFSPGDITANLTLTVVDDNIVDGNEDIIVTVTSSSLITSVPPALTLTITDNDRAGVVVDTDPDMDGAQTALAVTEEGAAGEYTLVLTSQPTHPVTVTVSLPAGADIGLTGLTSGALTFSTANWSTPQPVTVSAMNDANTVNETVTLSHTASSTDTDYDGITVSSVTVTVTDNDIPALAFSAASYSVQETGGNVATLTVTISPQLAAPSSVTVQVSGGTATQGADYSLSTAVLSLPASMGMATFTVTGLADMTTEGDETVALELAAAAGAPYNLGAQRTTEVTIMDNSLTPPGVVPSVSALTVAEGATASYTLVLRAPPAAAVTVTPTSSDTGAVTVSAALMFTTDNWDSAQTVTVTSVQNEEAGDVTVAIGHAAVSTDSGYDGISIAPVAVTVQDDEGAPLDEVSQALVPELSRVLADSTVGAVAQRIARIVDGQAGAGAAGAALGGQSSLDALVRAHAPALSEGQLTLAGLLDGSAFVLPLQGITGPEDPSWLSDLTLWGGGQYRKFSDKGGDGQALDWEGDAFTAQLGLDARLRNDWLVGVAGAWSRGVVDYRRLDAGGAGGAGGQEYRLTLGSVLPYLSWTPGPRVNLWLSGGYGQGAVRLSQPAGVAVSSDMSQRLVAGGGNVRLVERGRASLHLRLEGQGVWTAVDGSRGGELSAHDVQTRTVRALVRGSNTVVLSGGGSLAPVLELGARHDGGDGDTGVSAQLGGELRYRSARGGLQAEGGGQWLLGRDRYREWGVWGLVSWADGPDGRGWSLRLRPRYGLGGSGGGLEDVERLWERGGGGLAGALSAPSASAVPSGQLDLRLGYGLARGLGLFAPYSELSLAEASRRWRLGVQWRLGEWWDVDLVGERLERTGAGAAAGQGRNPEHRLLLEGRIRY